jgi:hypothetical protein
VVKIQGRCQQGWRSSSSLGATQAS